MKTGGDGNPSALMLMQCVCVCVCVCRICSQSLSETPRNGGLNFRGFLRKKEKTVYPLAQHLRALQHHGDGKTPGSHCA